LPTGPDRIAKVKSPSAPPRPQGIERNVVITEWDWADPKAYLHDQVSTDRRNPRVNANGLIYGALELSADYLPVLDPVHHTIAQVPLTVRDPRTQVAQAPAVIQPSPYGVARPSGRARTTCTTRCSMKSGVCGSRPSSDRQIIRRTARPGRLSLGEGISAQLIRPPLAMYDPKTKQITHIDTCFRTHHLMFAEDANQTLWTSGGGQVVGWLNRKMWEQTHDEEKSQGWTALIMDTNGNGRRDAYVEPNAAVDARKTSDSAAASTPSRRRRMARCGAPSWAFRARS
jgi:hypothetical protein